MTELEPGLARALEGSTILVADDEVLIALDIEDTLLSAGARIAGPCMTLTAALEAAHQHPLTAAVLDVSLGRETSEPVVDLLVARGIPIVFCTGNKLPETMRQKAPQALVFGKPLPHKALVEALTRLTKA